MIWFALLLAIGAFGLRTSRRLATTPDKLFFFWILNSEFRIPPGYGTEHTLADD